ncbi:MAG: hypothetical protein ACERKD_24405 [Prolixibacteraceae bacterium]
MKKIDFAIIIIILILIQGCTNTFNNGIKIVGEVTNSNQEYVYLAHQPLYRGNLNFDGFKSIGDRIDDKGNFTLISDKVIDEADYWIQVKDRAFHLILFNGDNIKIKFDLKDINNSLFAQGNGAGKINILRLPQFDSNLSYDTTYTMDTYKLCVDSVIESQLLFLNVIFKKDLKNEIVQNAKNKQEIISIIEDSPLSEKEYEFLKKKISIQDIYYLEGFPSYLSQLRTNDSSKVEFSNSYFTCFNPAAYKDFKNISYWQFEDCINNILKMEYLKSIRHENQQLTYGNFGIDDYSKYQNWRFNYAKDNLNPEVFDAYCASELTDGLSMGDLNKTMYEKFIQNCSSKKYINRINSFVDLLNNGLNDTVYNLNTLNSQKLDSLLKSKNGKNVYVIIWSSQFAGASIISELPSIIDFEKENLGQIEIFNLCIDKEKYKNLWAARIIDNSWKGNHNFLPAENNDSIINLFSAQNISGFCDGGATYSFIDKNGNISNNIEAPILMTKEKINQYRENTVR